MSQSCKEITRPTPTISNLDSILKRRYITLPAKARLVKAMVFPVVMYGCELDYKESWVQKNWCFWTVVLEKTLESPLDCKAIQPVHPKEDQSWLSWKDWCWSWNSNTLATWSEELTHLKRPWCLERLRAEGEGDDGGWEGWMASSTQWTWVWLNFRSWWWIGRPGILQSMGSQRVRHDWATELNSHNLHFKIMGLEQTIERSYQTHSYNIHFKMTGLVIKSSQEGETLPQAGYIVVI